MRGLIVTVFPAEDPDLLYLEVPEEKGPPEGRLYSYYSNMRRRGIEVEIIERLRNKGQEPEILEDFESIDANEELKTTVTPWYRVESLWVASFETRLGILSSCETFDHYLNQYPCLKDPRGRFLISRDGHKQMVQKRWDESFSFAPVLRNLPEMIKKNLSFVPQGLQYIVGMIEDINLSCDVRGLLSLALLPFCMKPTNKRRRDEGDENNGGTANGTNGRRSNSFANDMNSARAKQFLLFLPIFETLEAGQESARSRKRSVYPFGYLVLEKQPFKLIFVIQIGETVWQYENPVDGYDSLIKIFHGMNIKFTPEVSSLYWIAQNLTHNLDGKSRQSVTARQLLSDLQKEV